MTTTAARIVDQRVRDALHAKGLRCTTSRLRVLHALAEASRHLSAVEIHERLTRTGEIVDGIDITTVYRTLLTLHELGLVHLIARADQSPRYGLTDRPHHHAICINCGTVSEIDADLLRTAVDAAAHASRHSLAGTSGLELHGLCPACQHTATPTAPR